MMLSVGKIKRKSKRLRCYIIFVILFLSVSSIIYKSSPYYHIQSLNCSQLCPYSSIFINHTLQFDSSHSIRHFPNFICPQNFRNLADWIYGWPDQFLEHVEVTTSQGKQIAPCLPSGSIIYVRIWMINEFFDQIYPHLQNDFVLITGEGDVSSPTHMKHLEGSDSKIIHWFGQNGQYDVSKSKKFTHLPIGINCYQMADAIQSVYSQQPSLILPPVFNDSDEPSSYILPQDISHRALTTTMSNKSLLLLNFNPGTDTSRFRSHLWKTICSRKNRQHFTYATCIVKPSGIHMGKLSRIYERNRQYPFWLSPRGGGLDCHRTWEALYLDIIPIVWNSSLNVLYHNLPVLIINDYSELNEGFLYEKLNEISKKKLSKEKMYEYEKLHNAYWRRLILDKSRHKENRNVHKRQNQCWRAEGTVAWKQFLPFF